MIKRLLGLLLIVLLGSLLGALIHHSPGYVLLAYQSFSVETSLWALLVLLLLFYFFINLIGNLIASLLATPGGVRRWWQKRSETQRYKTTLAGLHALLLGNWRAARSGLGKTAEQSEVPLLHFMGAAKAAWALGKQDEYESWLSKAEREGKEGQVLAALSLAETLMLKGDHENAKIYLDKAEKLASKHPQLAQIKALLNISSARLPPKF